MAFRTVFRILQEVFPQIDNRMLKAVAIEYSKDADAAVEFILSDVLPVIETTEDSPLVVTCQTEYPFPNGRADRRGTDFKYQGTQANTSEIPSSKSASETPAHDMYPGVIYASSSMQERQGSHHGETIAPNLLPTIEQNELLKSFHKLGSSVPEASGSKDNLYNDGGHYAQSTRHFDDMPSGTSDSNVVVDSISRADLGQLNASMEVVQTPQSILSGSDSKHALDHTFDIEVDSNLDTSFNLLDLMDFGAEWENNMISNTNENEKQLSEPSNNIPSIQDKCNLQVDTIFLPALTSGVDDLFLMETFPESLTDVNGGITNISSAQSHSEEEPRCLAVSNVELLASENETISAGNYSQTAVADTGSSQISSIDFLGDSIIAVESSKKELLLALDSAAKKLKQVELYEETAKQAKDVVSIAAQDILVGVENLQLMTRQAKEANDKSTGEIYGERALLETEARDIQSCLTNILNEKDKSLSVIDQIHQTLDARLAAAEKERMKAEKERVEMERLASEALHEQEIIMENIKLESERLQLESLKNLKLREFLMESGRLVDTLRGEIAVVCEDVLLLKQRVEEAVPFKNPILAEPSTNTSNDKDTLPESLGHSSTSVRPQMVLCEPKEQDPESGNDAHKEEFSDDDWEIFDSKAELCS